MAFVNSSVLVLNDSGAVHSFQTTQDSPLSVAIPAGSTGTWSWVVSRAGYTAQVGTFDAAGGGVDSASPTPAIRTQANGATLYTASTSPLVTVSFDATPRCFIDIGDGSVTAQQVIDVVAVGLETQAGCQFLSATGGSQSSFSVLGGQTYLLLGTGYRLRRATAGDVNATVEAFGVSADGTSVDGSNGAVQLLSSGGLTPAEIWNYLATEPTVAGSMKDLQQLANDNALAANVQTKT